MQKLKSNTLHDYTVEIETMRDGNNWETGEHIGSPNNMATKVVKRGRTYSLKVTTPSGKVMEHVAYSVGSGLTHDKNGKEVHPVVEDVLVALFWDYEAIAQNNSFEEYADSFGYDTDSRKAYTDYMGVCEQYTKITEVFTHDELNALGVIAADY